MAFGISPKYIQEYSFNGLAPAEFLAIAIAAAKKLGWNMGQITPGGFVVYTPFSMSSWSEEVRVSIDGDHAVLKSECTGNQIVDWGKNKRNIEALICEFEALKASASPEELSEQYEALKSDLPANNNAELTEIKGKPAGFFGIFRPREGFFITPIIIDLNILIFILMVLSGVDFIAPGSNSLLAWGANFRPATLEGGGWRLLTNVFLHIGIIHLLFNMYALLYIGLLLEPHLGKLRFATAYILTGIAASTASLCWNEMTISAGASGAIFGMYGVFLAMLTTNLLEKAARKTLLTSIGIFVGYNLLNGVKGGIDNAAHVGGLVSGFSIGYLYYPSLKQPGRMDLKAGAVAGVTVVTLFICGLVYWRIPDDIRLYDEKMKDFVSMESMALEVYSLPSSMHKDSLLSEIKDRGIYYWNESIQLINKADQLRLPEQVHERDKALTRYCKLRIKVYNLMYKALDENTLKYKDSIEIYNKKIKELVDRLSGK